MVPALFASDLQKSEGSAGIEVATNQYLYEFTFPSRLDKNFIGSCQKGKKLYFQWKLCTVQLGA